jgi:hypothetical protein
MEGNEAKPRQYAEAHLPVQSNLDDFTMAAVAGDAYKSGRKVLNFSFFPASITLICSYYLFFRNSMLTQLRMKLLSVVETWKFWKAYESSEEEASWHGSFYSKRINH